MVAFHHGEDVSLTCVVRAYPTPIVFWNGTNGVILTVNSKYDVNHTTSPHSEAEVTSTLTVKKASGDDVGRYFCVAKNSLGTAKALIRIHSTNDLRAKFF